MLQENDSEDDGGDSEQDEVTRKMRQFDKDMEEIRRRNQEA